MQRAGTPGPAYPEGRRPTGSRTTNPYNASGAEPRTAFALPRPRPRAGPRVSVAYAGDLRAPPRPPGEPPALSAAGRRKARERCLRAVARASVAVAPALCVVPEDAPVCTPPPACPPSVSLGVIKRLEGKSGLLGGGSWNRQPEADPY